jgi:hypothetical protein
MTSMMLLTPMTPAASVPKPTIHTSVRMPKKTPENCLNSFSMFHEPNAALVVGGDVVALPQDRLGLLLDVGPPRRRRAP